MFIYYFFTRNCVPNRQHSPGSRPRWNGCHATARQQQNRKSDTVRDFSVESGIELVPFPISRMLSTQFRPGVYVNPAGRGQTQGLFPRPHSAPDEHHGATPHRERTAHVRPIDLRGKRLSTSDFDVASTSQGECLEYSDGIAEIKDAWRALLSVEEGDATELVLCIVI